MNGIPALERSIQLFNGLSQWRQCMILSKTTPKQRAEVIHKFIEVGKVCVSLHIILEIMSRKFLNNFFFCLII
jgi:RAS guanyl-releasing protein 3